MHYVRWQMSEARTSYESESGQPKRRAEDGVILECLRWTGSSNSPICKVCHLTLYVGNLLENPFALARKFRILKSKNGTCRRFECLQKRRTFRFQCFQVWEIWWSDRRSDTALLVLESPKWPWFLHVNEKSSVGQYWSSPTLPLSQHVYR